MVTIPQTPITEHSFKKWNAIKIDDIDINDMEYYYYIIPLPNDSIDDISERPTIISTASDEWQNLEIEEGRFLVSLFDWEDLPFIETEEEVELLYKILTKQNLTK